MDTYELLIQERDFYIKISNELGGKLLKSQEETTRAKTDVRRSNLAASVISYAYKLANESVDLAKFYSSFVQYLIEKMNVDGAGIYFLNGNSVEALTCLNLPTNISLDLFSSKEFMFSSKNDPITSEIEEALGYPFLLWRKDDSTKRAILFSRKTEDLRLNLPFTESNRYLADNIISILADIEKKKKIELEERDLKIRIEKYNQELEKKVKERTIELEKEKESSEKLLLNILPEETAKELKKFGSVKARHFDNVTILFADVIGFTNFAESIDSVELIDTLNYYFYQFDLLCEKHEIEKIKTIGDAYLAAGNLLESKQTTALDILNLAIEMRNFCRESNRDQLIKNPLGFRIGVHIGPVIAGVVGKNKFQYDVWGDTVNVAARLEQNSANGMINVSREIYLKTNEYFEFEYRGLIAARNRGELNMYWCLGPK